MNKDFNTERIVQARFYFYSHFSADQMLLLQSLTEQMRTRKVTFQIHKDAASCRKKEIYHFPQ